MSSPRPLGAIVLAAGLGTRMRSERAKVLHEIAGRPLLHYPLRALRPLGPERVVVVVGHQADAVGKAARDAGLEGVTTALQAEQRGTGHAVQCALPGLAGFDGDVLILYGDAPLIQTASLDRLVAAHRTNDAVLSLLTVWFQDPTGYGRIVRDDAGRVRGIVEQKDATPAERAIQEINPGFYCVRTSALSLLDQLQPNNAQSELYLTDVVGLVAGRGERVETVMIERAEEVAGINTRAELARMETAMRREIVSRWMTDGVSFEDPETAYVGADVVIGRDTIVGPNVTLRGATRIGQGCRLDGTNRLEDAHLGDGAHLGFGCVARGAAVAAGTAVAPFAQLGPARASRRKPLKRKSAPKARTKARTASRRKR